MKNQKIKLPDNEKNLLYQQFEQLLIITFSYLFLYFFFIFLYQKFNITLNYFIKFIRTLIEFYIVLKYFIEYPFQRIPN